MEEQNRIDISPSNNEVAGKNFDVIENMNIDDNEKIKYKEEDNLEQNNIINTNKEKGYRNDNSDGKDNVGNIEIDDDEKEFNQKQIISENNNEILREEKELEDDDEEEEEEEESSDEEFEVPIYSSLQQEYLEKWSDIREFIITKHFPGMYTSVSNIISPTYKILPNKTVYTIKENYIVSSNHPKYHDYIVPNPPLQDIEEVYQR
eukprot:TRINITY_DN375_c0_g1_i1.p1 TRINITY_DN375_c0_g1~~TRINITY_DN375_c0_g1_i1.p1  ORF type:complete len:205 (-),score=66.56 TRINITY_DN375_c0_g1_i1:26-640(-)